MTYLKERGEKARREATGKDRIEGGVGKNSTPTGRYDGPQRFLPSL